MIPNVSAYLDPQKPVAFLNVDGSEAFDLASRSYHNDVEERVAALVVRELSRLGVRSESIGVITPYIAQRNRLRARIRNDSLQIDTVDSFQGREKDVVILDLVASRGRTLSFVSDPSRLNVALTRARKKLVVIGNERAITSRLDQGNILPRFLEFCRQHGCVFDLAK